jgi:hypothetical protein
MSDFELSPDGKMIACVGIDFALLYLLNEEKIENQINLLDFGVKPGHKVTFSSNSKTLFISTLTNEVQSIDLKTNKVVYSIDFKDQEKSTFFPDSIQTMKSFGNELIVCFNSSIFICEGKEIIHESHIGSEIILSLHFHTSRPGLFSILKSGNTILTYDLGNDSVKEIKCDKNGTIVDFSLLGSSFLECHSRGIKWNNQVNFYLFNSQKIGENMKDIFLGVLHLGNNECMLIFKPKIDLEIGLPPICYRHRYGT